MQSDPSLIHFVWLKKNLGCEGQITKLKFLKKKDTTKQQVKCLELLCVCHMQSFANSCLYVVAWGVESLKTQLT